MRTVVRASLQIRHRWPEGVNFTLGEARSICGGIASALAYLHAKRICHGDVYAHNILYDPETRHAVLCDFGGRRARARARTLARMCQACGPAASAHVHISGAARCALRRRQQRPQAAHPRRAPRSEAAAR